MKRVPNIGLTTLLALFAAGVVSFFVPKDAEKYLSRRFWIHKTFTSASYDLVVMGDSRVYRGISPEIMEKKLKPLKVLNFGYSNGGLNPEMFGAAEKKLNSKIRPKVMVLGVAANTVTGYSVENKQYRQELSRTREERLEAMYLGTLKYWFSPTTPEQILEGLCSDKEEAYYRNQYFMNGYVASEKFPADTIEALPSYRRDFSKYQVEDRYLEPLFEQVKKWSEKGIFVIGFRPPVSLPMQQLEDSLGRYDEALLRDGFEQAGGNWLDLDRAQYKTYDGSHVTIEAAEKLSNRLADEISDLLK